MSKSIHLSFAVVAIVSASFPRTLSAAAIRNCGDLDSFKPGTYLAVAVQLQSVPKEAAITQLQWWADFKQYDEQVIILCRMLFEPRKGREFRRPLLGGPGFYGGTDMNDWPLEPIAVIDGVPFLIVNGYRLGGHAESAASYLRYCTANADWTARRYHIASKREMEAGLQKLLNSPLWKRPLNEWEISLIKRQSEK